MNGIIVKPASFLQINFQSYVELWKSTLNENPQLPLDLNKPSAFLESLNAFDLTNSHLWGHVYCGFFIKASKSVCSELIKYCTCKNSRWDGFENDLVLVTGDLYTFWQTVIILCNENKQISIRYIGNCLFLLLQKSGFKPIFSLFTKASLSDGTFVLKRK